MKLSKSQLLKLIRETIQSSEQKVLLNEDDKVTYVPASWNKPGTDDKAKFSRSLKVPEGFDSGWDQGIALHIAEGEGFERVDGMLYLKAGDWGPIPLSDLPCPGQQVSGEHFTLEYIPTEDWCEKCGGTWDPEAKSPYNFEGSSDYNHGACKPMQFKKVVQQPKKEDDDDGGGGIYGKIATDDPCFDGRPDTYVMGGRKSFGDWVYKLSKQNKKAKDQWNDGFYPLVEKLKTKMDNENANELQMSMLTDVEMEVFKVTKKGETGTEADATSKRVGYTFLLKDIKPRKSEEAASWDVHPLSKQVLQYLKTGPGDGATIECPAGDTMREGKLNRQQLRSLIEDITGCGC